MTILSSWRMFPESMEDVVEISPNFGGISEGFFYLFGGIVVIGGVVAWVIHVINRRK